MRIELLSLLLLCSEGALAADTSLDQGWRFHRGDEPAASGSSCVFPADLGQQRCSQFIKLADASIHVPQTAASCADACCAAGDSCTAYQFCPKSGSCAGQDTGVPGTGMQGCWVGTLEGSNCIETTDGWISKGRATGTCAAGRFCAPGFDDASWDSIDVPHDWSILTLPSRSEDASAPILSPRYGEWAFAAGDHCGGNATCACCGADAVPDPQGAHCNGCSSVPARATSGFDDSAWQRVKGGSDWRIISNLTAQNATGWYRQHLSVPPLFLRQTVADPLILDLGIISGADFTYLNGVLIGQSGQWGNPGCDDYENWRRYPVPPSLLRAKGNLLSVRVFSKGGRGASPLRAPFGYPGGLFDDPVLGPDADVRSGPFDAGASVNGRSLGYAVGGIGWYRNSFQTPASSAPPSVSVRFDGIYENSDVFVNGQLVGHHPYGYTGFEYDVSHLLRPAGEKNSLAVRVANTGKNSRWYSGSGIYRHVVLSVRSAVHVPRHGVVVTTPEIDLVNGTHASGAVVQVVATVRNSGGSDAKATVRVQVVDESGWQHVTVVVAANSSAAVRVNVTLGGSVQLWTPDTPVLHRVSVGVSTAGEDENSEAAPVPADPTDVTFVNFGVRHLQFDAAKGFRPNGVETKLYGGCVHHDNGPLGSAAIDRAEERRVELLKKQGYNAIRTSHNPVSPAFLDACDRLGVMVMSEAFDTWPQGKNTDDYHVHFDKWWRRDLSELVMRDRNRASVVMWSIGNEIPCRSTPLGANLSLELSTLVRSLDVGSGRAVTAAYPGVPQDPKGAATSSDPFFAPLDVAGYNYSPDNYWPDHQRLPDRVIVGTESFATSSFQMWSSVWNNSWIVGDFIWTAMDYLGESSIGFETQTDGIDECDAVEPFPFHVSFCGDLDLIGQPKPQALYRQVLWGKSMLEMAVHVPTPAGHDERVGGWGWPEERASWTWAAGSNTGSSLAIGDGTDSADEGCPCWPCPCNPRRPELASMKVNVYTKECDSVLLFINGKQQGGPVPSTYDSQFTATFSNIAYTPGNLTAVGLRDGSACATQTLLTAGPVASLHVVADRGTIHHSRDDLSYVTVTALDAKGVPVPDAANLVSFALSQGSKHTSLELAAVGSGDPRDVSALQGVSKRKLWRGNALAILRPTVGGAANSWATLTVSAVGLPSASVTVHVVGFSTIRAE